MAKRNLKLDTPDNIRKALAKVANMTYKGEIDTKTANSITATCNVILSGIRVDDQEKKIAELERILNEMKITDVLDGIRVAMVVLTAAG